LSSRKTAPSSVNISAMTALKDLRSNPSWPPSISRPLAQLLHAFTKAKEQNQNRLQGDQGLR
jgi:hypothetical protein